LISELIEAGWKPKNLLALVIALAVLRAESGKDPKAYLAYIEIGSGKAYVTWKKQNPGLFALAHVKEDLRRIPTNLTPLALQETLKFLKRKYRISDDSPLLRVVAWDRGLMQISSKWHPDVNPAQAFTIKGNLKAARKIYEGRGNSFNAWSSYTSGAYARTLPAATKAVNKYLEEPVFPIRVLQYFLPSKKELS